MIRRVGRSGPAWNRPPGPVAVRIRAHVHQRIDDNPLTCAMPHSTSSRQGGPPGGFSHSLVPLRNPFPLGVPFCGPVLIWLVLSTVVVAPTTCSYYLFLLLVRVFPNIRRIEGGVFPNIRRIGLGGLPEYTWKTPSIHWPLWKNIVTGSPRSGFQRRGHPYLPLERNRGVRA